MAFLNLGVKALLSWVNNIILAHREINIEELRDGEFLLRVVHKLKKEPNPPLIQSTEERFKVIAEFVENDCRFSPTKGTSLSWDNIRNGVNLTVEIAKVLLLLVYHDMMSERCTLKTLDCEVEREIANLTISFVMESHGSVFLSSGLDAYLAKRYLPVPPEILTRTASTSSSSASTASTLSDEDSPVFHCTKKITFVDMHTVASSSVSKSPLQDIMNTPKFQLRKIQRQMIKEQDYRDGLEKELAGKISLITQRECHINQLQYCLDKMKREQSDQELMTKEQINELETKNNSLQLRLNEILKDNKDCKSNFSLMERKVNELEEENGVLSSQMRRANAQLLIFQAEVGRLTETLASGQEEWRAKMDYLQSELGQATAQKELLAEQIQILQGKISCLEDEIRGATKQDLGENMGSVMERDELECEIDRLKNKLDSTFGSLKKAEANVEAKILQLSAYEQEIAKQKELLEQQNLQIEDIVQAKDCILKELQKEISEQRAALQKEIDHLKFQLEQAEQQKAQEISELQKLIAALQQELDTLRETTREKEHLLNQAKEKVKDLETKFHDLTAILVDKDNQINLLKEEVKVITIETMKSKDEIESKDQLLAQLRLETSNQQVVLQNRIQTLTVEVENLSLSVQRAEQEVQLKHDLLARTEQENIKQKEVLQQQILTSEVEASRLSTEIEARNEQLVILHKDSSKESEILQEQINHLKSHVDSLNNSLKKAEDDLQSLKELLAQQEQESAGQKDLLLQQLSVSEESVRTMKAEIQTKEEHIALLNKQFSETSQLLHQDIHSLEEQVESLTSSLKNAEENLKSKESLFAKQHSQSTLEMEKLQTQMISSQEEVSRLISKLNAKEEQLSLHMNESSTQSELLEQKIDSLDKQLESLNHSLCITKDQVKAKEDLIVKLEKENTFHIEALKKHNMDLLQEAKQFKEEVQTKDHQFDLFRIESSKQSESLKNEIQSLKRQIQSVTESLQTAEEQVKTKVDLLENKEIAISTERNKYQSLTESSSAEVTMLRERIQALEQQLATQKESSLQTDMLHKEIGQLKDQLAAVNNLLSEAEQRVEAQSATMTAQEQECVHQKKLLNHQLSASEAEMRKLTVEIQVRDERIMQLNANHSKQSDLLGQEIQHLKKKVESLREAEEDIHIKNDLLTQQQMEKDMKLQEMSQKEEILQKRLCSFETEILKLRECHDEKQKLLIKTEEELDLLKSELAAVKTQTAEKDHSLNTLNAELAIQAKLVQKAKQEAQDNAKMLAKIQEEAAKTTHALKLELVDLKRQLEVMSLQRTDKGQQILETQQLSPHLMEELQLSQPDVSKMKVAFADLNLCTHNQIPGHQGGMLESFYLEVPGSHSNVHTKVEPKKIMSSDSLDQSSLEDLLNNTRTISAPDESSTPLVRSSERLAAKRHGLKAESLETLYFTPINTRHINRTTAESNTEVDLRYTNPLSSVKRRRTTQVINITMTKKTPGGVEGEETFYSLASAYSQPNLASAHGSRPVSMEVFDTPARMTATASDQLSGLPGYRRSTLHSQTASTFGVGAENEPEGAPDDWMRIAELQARNKACLPHLKSSYPVEFEAGWKSVLPFTDEDVRTGDPTETIRRASVMPGQLQDSLASHRHSLAAVQSSTTAGVRSHSLSLMAHHPTSKSVGTSQLKSPRFTKRAASTLCVPQTSPEVDRRQSLMFTVDNTPKNNGSSNYLKRGLNKLRSSTRKSPGKTSKRSPVNAVQNKNKQAATSRTVARRAARGGSFKSPQMVLRENKKSPQTLSKSPQLTTSARKKTPGGVEGEETFYSLASAHSQPNLSSAHGSRPVSIEVFDTPAKMTATASDQFSSLPGYRRSTLHSQTASTFGVGAENEPEGAPDDWMRIAELQARNKACRPHLKSSYPAEFEAGCKSALPFTDEDVRTGDPTETIRRASVMPGQLQDSLASHRHSLAAVQSSTAAGIRSHRLSLMADHPTSKSISSSQLKSPRFTKRAASTLCVPQTSPEKKLKGSCFPRPLTPKNKNVNSGPSNSQLDPVISPVNRRQSMMFTIDNTPNKSSNNYLKRGLNKLRSSTRKSPSNTSKNAMQKENKHVAVSRAAAGRAGRGGSSKSPQVICKENRKSPQTTSRSPRLTASARKMKRRMV
ncbi:nuclear mitotic apparatus protein 1 isoform X3 [Hippocampus zosterae]|uniref:nuclear mitotic apparatus protein 1 isoform X2 n=1 Tax=Hippocampus zosterae TaxID=109293 RepID=UPI00223E0332|nr:nuclear mitotic apparatus protein 1 isoform X2 [Hippocampus zosterae]XP_051935104.1 nuclear mitotic apparatus protein 1 isoform X3 [Hippocampus zosterae]